jgi:putative transposase
MPLYSAEQEWQDCDRVLAPFVSHPDLPFADVLTGPELQQAFTDDHVSFGKSRTAVYTPPLTLWAWLSQAVCKEKACVAAALRVGVLLVVLGRTPGDTNSGTYCRARAKIPQPCLRRVAVRVGRTLERQLPRSWLWCGRHVHLVDGFTITAADTAANQRRYPQPRSQKPGLGFPMLRLVLLVSLITATVQDLAYGPYEGKETGETALLRSVMDELVCGDVLVMDRYFCSYFLLAQALARGQDVVARLHQCRDYDFQRGHRLGPGDHVVVWQRPQRPTWMTEQEYATIPETLTVREVLVQVREPGFRVESLVVVTTLLEPEYYGKEEIGDLYRQRWQVELDIRSLKVGLQLEHLRNLSPEMIHRELWANVLGYNLLRKVGAQAALLHQRHPRTISFTATKQAVEGSWQVLSNASAEEQWELGSYLLKELSKHRVADRPNRCEPRAVKKRPKKQKLLTKPRAQAKAELLGNRSGAEATGSTERRR